ncbi:SsrA-binding protein [Clostridia bacterium]|nr:SsrA-binding protein [Clostridia bacterium]
MKTGNGAIKIVCNNKKAYHEYFIEETYEAGIALTGSEIKSIRADKVNINDAFVFIRDGQAVLKNVNIVPYEKGSFFNPEAKRDRKLLLHSAEIARIKAKTEAKGYTVVPTKLYFKDNLVKVEIALARGKQLHDKRETIARKDLERRVQRDIRDAMKR